MDIMINPKNIRIRKKYWVYIHHDDCSNLYKTPSIEET